MFYNQRILIIKHRKMLILCMLMNFYFLKVNLEIKTKQNFSLN